MTFFPNRPLSDTETRDLIDGLTKMHNGYAAKPYITYCVPEPDNKNSLALFNPYIGYVYHELGKQHKDFYRQNEGKAETHTVFLYPVQSYCDKEGIFHFSQVITLVDNLEAEMFNFTREQVKANCDYLLTQIACTLEELQNSLI